MRCLAVNACGSQRLPSPPSQKQTPCILAPKNTNILHPSPSKHTTHKLTLSLTRTDLESYIRSQALVVLTTAHCCQFYLDTTTSLPKTFYAINKVIYIGISINRHTYLGNPSFLEMGSKFMTLLASPPISTLHDPSGFNPTAAC